MAWAEGLENARYIGGQMYSTNPWATYGTVTNINEGTGAVTFKTDNDLELTVQSTQIQNSNTGISSAQTNTSEAVQENYKIGDQLLITLPQGDYTQAIIVKKIDMGKAQEKYNIVINNGEN